MTWRNWFSGLRSRMNVDRMMLFSARTIGLMRCICVDFPMMVIRFLGKCVKWSLITVGVIALCVVGMIVLFFSIPDILNVIDARTPAFFDEHVGTNRDLVVKLHDPNYYAEQTEIFANEKMVACFSSPDHRVKIDNLKDVPEQWQHAVIASEDKNFFSHKGIDMGALVRAAFKQYALKESTSGASTVTMQIAKELRGGTGRRSTAREKVSDIVTALRIERVFTKEQILLRYLNMPYLGRGQLGIEAASRAYFGKTAQELPPHQIAFIVSLINKPALPDRSYATSKVGVLSNQDVRDANWRDVVAGTRRVLARMLEDGYLSDAQYATEADAIDTQLRNEVIPRSTGCGANDYFLEHVRVSYKDTLPLNKGGLTIAITRDDELQQALRNAVQLTMLTYLSRHEGELDNDELRAGAVAVKFNGDVLAEVGNIDYRRVKYDVIATGWRQPGSTFKIFTYGGLVEQLTNAVLEEDTLHVRTLEQITEEVTRKCVVLDAPVGVSLGRGRGVKIIQNFHSLSGKTPQYWGEMTCKAAVARSQNAAAIRAGQRAGIRNVIDLAYRMGMPKNASHPLQPYPTTAIGASEVNPLGMAGVIAFVNGGYKVTPRFVYDVCKDGKSVITNDEDGRPRTCDKEGSVRSVPERVLHPVVSEVMMNILRGPFEDEYGTLKSLRRGVIPGMDPLGSDIWKLNAEERKKRTLAFPLETSGELAGKTGTATNADGRTSDVWLIVFVPGPELHPEEGIMLLFWMGKDSKDHPLGERGAHGGNIRPETGGRNWSHSVATVLKFLQDERGLLRAENKFRPIYEDDVLKELLARTPQEEGGLAVDGVSEQSSVVDPLDETVDPALVKEFQKALTEEQKARELLTPPSEPGEHLPP